MEILTNWKLSIEILKIFKIRKQVKFMIIMMDVKHEIVPFVANVEKPNVSWKIGNEKLPSVNNAYES
jgi:hypothetical protein